MKLIHIVFAWSLTFFYEAGAQAQPGAEASSSYSDIIPLDAATFQKYKDDPNTTWFDAIVDVRTYSEWKSGHIANATLLENLASYNNSSTSQNGIAAQNSSSPADLGGCEYCNIVVYCRSGNRAGAALQILREAGFVGRLYNGQGVSQWTAAGFPLVTTLESATPPCKVNKTASEQCRLSYLNYTRSAGGGGAAAPRVASNNTAAPVVSPTTPNRTAAPVASPTTRMPPSSPSVAWIANEEYNRTCEANSACYAENLTGLCCPTMDNKLLDCCNGANIEQTCELNGQCSAAGLKGSCCPTRDGHGHLDCCSTFPTSCADGNCNVTSTSNYLEFLADNSVSGSRSCSWRVTVLLLSSLLSAIWHML